MEKEAMSQSSGPGNDAPGSKELPDNTEPVPIPNTTNAPEVYSEETQYATGLALLGLVVCICMTTFLVLLDTSILSVAIPRITDEFKSLLDVGWYGSAFLLSSAALQPLTGKMYTKFGVKWVFFSLFVVFELGSLLCAVATSSTMFIVGRAVAGIGASGLINGCLTLVATYAHPARRPLLTGLAMGIGQLGVAFGPLIGGAFTEYTTWRWCFYVNLPVGGLVLLLITTLRIGKSSNEETSKFSWATLHHDLDLLGSALLAGATIQLLLAVQYGGNDFAWNSATIIGLLCGAVATFALWFVWNWHRGDDALIPMSMLRKRIVWSNSVTSMCLMATLLLISYYLPIYFQAILNANPIMSGVYFLPSILPQLFFTLLASFLVTKTGYPLPYLSFGAAIFAIGTGLLSLLTPSTPMAQWVGFLVLIGAGRGLSMQMPFIVFQVALEKSEIPVASSLIVFMQYLGGAVFLAAANAIFSQQLESQLIAYAPSVDPAVVIGAGATGFQHVVSSADLPHVLEAYAAALSKIYYLGGGILAISVFTAWGLGWLDIRKNFKPEQNTNVDV